MDQQQHSAASETGQELRLEQAQALGFATIEEMHEHQRWLERKGTPEYMEGLAAQKQQQKPVDMRFAKAVVAAVDAHVQEAVGTRPIAEWSDHDVLDHGILARALTDAGLPSDDTDVVKLEDVVSPLVFWRHGGEGAEVQAAMEAELTAYRNEAGIQRSVRFFNIQWDTDGQSANLPTEVTLEISDSDTDIATEGADILSDKYGWCVESFQFEWVPEVWSKEDSAAAQAHGWDLFQAQVDGKLVLLIERCDDSATFADDDKAVEFVRAQASSGDPVAAKALRLDHEISSRTPWDDWIGEVGRQFGEEDLSAEDKRAFRKHYDQGLSPSEAIHQNRPDSGCGAEEETEATQIVKMVVLCRNSEGAPEFHTCAVTVTPAQRESGDHYAMAEDNALDNGYEPQFSFEENDPAAKQLGEIHAWL
ncbi:MAG: hypothetical protein KBH35_03080 [Bifidobacterium sp.]|jgi:hypothetical protein|nr:hypothetical protein [Bifidobacterium sp.]